MTVPTHAGLGARTVAFVLDYLLIAAYLTVLVAGGAALRGASPSTSDALFGSAGAGQITGFLLITLPVTAYFALSESSSRQATWGKRRRGLTVTDTAGAQVSFSRAFARTLLKFVPWELAHTCIWQISFAADPSAPAYLAGFVAVWVLVGANIASLLASPTRQTLYDRLAGTRVQRSVRVPTRPTA